MEKKGKKKNYQRLRGDSGQHRRIWYTAICLVVVGFLSLAARLYHLMVVNYEYYSDLALRNQTRNTTVSADRGTIYDRNMNILAYSKTVEDIYLNPRELKQAQIDLDDLSRELGQLLSVDPQWIREQAGDFKLRYKRIASKVDGDTAASVRSYLQENNVRGVHIEPNSQRAYPYGSLAAQVIGFTNDSNIGSEGIEASYNAFLEGDTGTVITTKGNNEMDMPFSYEDYISSTRGYDLILTIDATVQACLEKQMETAIARYDVQNGAFGMVMDVDTGEILAMATLGSYDPNAYLGISDTETAQQLEQMKMAYLLNPLGSEAYTTGKNRYQQALYQAQLKQWRNRCLSDGYEPGSTFKVLTLAAALDCGAVELDTAFHCSGAQQIPGRAQLLHCWRSTGHGAQQTPQALQNSCNLAFANIGLRLGGERFYEYIQKFGVLEKTGIDLAGESKGVFFDRSLIVDTEKWGTASLTSASFGQTFKLTPLQLVRAIASVVNGGYLMEPYLVSEAVDAAGNTVLKQEPTVVRRTVSEETSRIMCDLIRSVVTEGTAKNATVAGFDIGGKTGTSEKIDVFDENGQRVQDKIVSFVGVAPMDDPRYIVLVALDTPSRSTGIYISGGVMAAPTVGAVMEDILPYLEVKRNYTEADAAGRIVILSDMTAMTKGEALKSLKDAGLTARCIGQGDTVTAQIPAAGQGIPGNSQVILYFSQTPEYDPVTVPDFTGMNRQQANDAAGALGLYIQVSGNNSVSHNVVVTAQSHAAGTQVPVGTTIRLEFADTGAKD